MRTIPWIAVLCLVAGCGGDGGTAKVEEEGHAEEPRHGGKIVVLGDDEAHVEMKVDHAAATVGLWFYDADMKPCAPDEAPVLNAKYPSGLLRLTATPGDDPEWTIRDDALKAEPEHARFQLKIGGKVYTPDLVHVH